jgi:hypothetical protein
LRRNFIMEMVMEKLIEVAAFILLVALIILAKRGFIYLKTLLTKEEAEELDAFVEELVGAADQLYKKDDPDGSIRLDYVYQMLIEAGHELTSALRAKIENKVLKLGHGGDRE